MKQRKFQSFLLIIGSFMSVFVIFGYTDRSLDGNKMLIITTPEYAKVMDKYIDWKIKRGLDVEVDIQSAKNGADMIQKKIQEKYDRRAVL